MGSMYYKSLNHSGYRFNICNIGQSQYDNLAYYDKTNFKDVQVLRNYATLDVQRLNTQCLFTINGYVYPSVVYSNGLYIPNAVSGLLTSNRNHMGLLSFLEYGKPFTSYRIDLDHVGTESPYSLYQKAYIQFPEPIKTPILVLLGYLVFENPQSFYKVSEDTFVLNLELLRLIERLYEISRYRPIVDELGIEVSPNNPSMFSKEDVTSDSIINKVLTHYTTFLLNFDVDGFQTEKIYLERSHVPDNFKTTQQPLYPMVTGYGKLIEYMIRKTTLHKYTVYTDDAYYNNHLFSYLGSDMIRVYNDHRDTRKTYELVQGYFLKVTY